MRLWVEGGWDRCGPGQQSLLCCRCCNRRSSSSSSLYGAVAYPRLPPLPHHPSLHPAASTLSKLELACLGFYVAEMGAKLLALGAVSSILQVCCACHAGIRDRLCMAIPRGNSPCTCIPPPPVFIRLHTSLPTPICVVGGQGQLFPITLELPGLRGGDLLCPCLPAGSVQLGHSIRCIPCVASTAPCQQAPSCPGRVGDRAVDWWVGGWVKMRGVGPRGLRRLHPVLYLSSPHPPCPLCLQAVICGLCASVTGMTHVLLVAALFQVAFATMGLQVCVQDGWLVLVRAGDR